MHWSYNYKKKPTLTDINIPSDLTIITQNHTQENGATPHCVAIPCAAIRHNTIKRSPFLHNCLPHKKLYVSLRFIIAKIALNRKQNNINRGLFVITFCIFDKIKESTPPFSGITFPYTGGLSSYHFYISSPSRPMFLKRSSSTHFDPGRSFSILFMIFSAQPSVNTLQVASSGARISPG